MVHSQDKHCLSKKWFSMPVQGLMLQVALIAEHLVAKFEVNGQN